MSLSKVAFGLWFVSSARRCRRRDCGRCVHFVNRTPVDNHRSKEPDLSATAPCRPVPRLRLLSPCRRDSSVSRSPGTADEFYGRSCGFHWTVPESGPLQDAEAPSTTEPRTIASAQLQPRSHRFFAALSTNSRRPESLPLRDGGNLKTDARVHASV